MVQHSNRMAGAQVVEVLRALPEQPPNLVEAIDFNMLATEELHALGRHITSLPPGVHSTPFWSDVARQVLQCLLHPRAGEGSPHMVLWEVGLWPVVIIGVCMRGYWSSLHPCMMSLTTITSWA